MGIYKIKTLFDGQLVELLNRAWFMSGEVIEDVCRVHFDDHTEIWKCDDWSISTPYQIA